MSKVMMLRTYGSDGFYCAQDQTIAQRLWFFQARSISTATSTRPTDHSQTFKDLSRMTFIDIHTLGCGFPCLSARRSSKRPRLGRWVAVG
jgi:hypothetical protein